MCRNYFLSILLMAVIFFSGCLGDNNSETIFSTYGVIEESTTSLIKIRTDDNRLLTVSNIEVFNPLPTIGLRILARYSTDADTSLQSYPIIIQSPYSSYINTLKVLSSADTLSRDSIGKNPVAITEAWFGGGFLNVASLGGYDYYNFKKFQYNVLKNPSNVDTLYLTLHFNDFIGNFFSRVYENLISINIDSLLIKESKEEMIISIGGYKEQNINKDSIRWIGTYFRAKKYKPILLEKSQK